MGVGRHERRIVYGDDVVAAGAAVRGLRESLKRLEPGWMRQSVARVAVIAGTRAVSLLWSSSAGAVAIASAGATVVGGGDAAGSAAQHEGWDSILLLLVLQLGVVR
jgi:hypothetical protein